MQPLVSFILPHRGRADLLAQTIQTILDQDYELANVEVLVCSQNEKLVLNEAFKNKVKLENIYCPLDATIAALRNKGAEISKGNYLAFLDADVQLSPNWIKMMIKEIESDPKRILVSAQQILPPNASIVEKIWININFFREQKKISSLYGRNLFLSKKAFKKIGGFPEHLKTCEDIYFTSRLSEFGKLYVTDRASYIHLGEDRTYKELFKKEIWRGTSNISSLKGRKIPPSEIPSILIPFWQAACAAVFVMSLICIKPIWLFLSLMTFFLIPLLYAFRLYLPNRNELKWYECLWFYVVYFTARTVGVIKGVVLPERESEKSLWKVPGQIFVSFIIPHRSRINFLKQTVQSILTQDCEQVGFEILILTQDGDLDLNDMCPNRGKLKVIYCLPSKTIGELRNEGARMASGNYLAFVDADVALSPNWLKTMIEELRRDDKRVLVNGVQRPGNEPTSTEKTRSRVRKLSGSISSANLFLSKDACRKVGGFPEGLQACEDIHFTSRLSKLGKLYVTDRASYIHLGEDKTYKELFKKEIWRGTSNISSLKGRKIPPSEIPSILIPFWQVACAAVFVMSLICIKPIWLFLSLMTFFLIPLLYAFRLYLPNRNELKWYECLWFYVVYFTARTVGVMKSLIVHGDK